MPNETWVDASNKQEACLADISGRMNANKLTLNQEKTEVITFQLKHQSKVTDKTYEKTVHAKYSVKNLGMYFDTSLATEGEVISGCIL